MTSEVRSTGTTSRASRSRQAPEIEAVQRQGSSWHVGLVVGFEGQRFSVLGERGPMEVRVSLSCLVLPETGDTVAYLDAGDGGAWIGCVLARADGEGDPAERPLQLASGPVQWTVRGAGLAVIANGFALDTHNVRISSRSIDMTVDRAQLVAGKARFIAGTIKLVATALASFTTRVQQFSESFTRSTTGLDRVSAAHIALEADTLAHLKAQHTVVEGEKLVKARGGQIHFG